MSKKFVVFPESHIRVLGLDTRIYHALFRAGITTVGELLSLNLAQLERIRGIGQTSIVRIHNRLGEVIIKDYLGG